MSSIMGPVEQEQLELIALELGKIAAFDFVYSPELQIYGAPAPMTQDLKKWHTTFQGNAPVRRILFDCE